MLTRREFIDKNLGDKKFAEWMVLPHRCDNKDCEGWQWRKRLDVMHEQLNETPDENIIKGYYTQRDVIDLLSAA